MNKFVEVFKTSTRQAITELDRLPFVDRSLVNYEKYNEYIGQSMVRECIVLQATRGCPYKCAFCHKIWPKKHMVRSAENLFQEVKIYYHMGVQRFAFVDDIFNFDRKNSARFFELILKNRFDVQLFFPNGLRCDLLTQDYIDLMIEAGTVNVAFALDTGSSRLQKFIGRNLNINKFRENLEYVCKKYPGLILDFHTIHGFPTETEEEAMKTLNFIKSVKWLHFPYVHILKIFPNTDMEKIALECGISKQAIARSLDLTFDELPYSEEESPLPFNKNFTYKYQAEFLHEYLLLKERLMNVLPYQMKLFTHAELVQKYNSFLPFKIKQLPDLLDYVGISKDEFKNEKCLEDNIYYTPHLNGKIRKQCPREESEENAIRILLVDLSLVFTGSRKVLFDVVEPPLGLMYVMTYLKQQMGSQVKGKVVKSRIDFDSYPEFKTLLEEFKPDIIGIRTLTVFKKFFWETVDMIRQWGIDVPIVTGGPYATSDYQAILQEGNVDLVVIGEGEITFHQLIAGMIENEGKIPDEEVLKKIPGLAFLPGIQSTLKKNKVEENPNVYVTGKRPQIKDLNNLPIPDRSLVDYEKYNSAIGMGISKSAIALQGSRGCPYKCAYCHKIWPRTHIYRSAENIFAEVQLCYDVGIRKFTIIDDIFNLNEKNSRNFFELIIKKGLDVEFYLGNGVRGDILTKEYIDLMVEAGTVTIALALETASPRLQKLIGKNLNIEKFRENVEYFCKKHPQVVTEVLTMLGFPTETQEEAVMTLDFIKSIKWIHIPFLNLLKIYPGTDMEKLAIANGISGEVIAKSQDFGFHEWSETLPFEKSFILAYQADFFHNYFLLKKRLLHVLPFQMKLFTDDEIAHKYNVYFPVEIKTFYDVLKYCGLKKDELSIKSCADNSSNIIPGLNRKFKERFPKKQPDEDALKILLLDLSHLFSHEKHRLTYYEAPIGLMYLMTYLNRQLGSKVDGKIYKSGIDFDNMEELRTLIEEYQPDVIGLRTLTIFKKLFHQTVEMIRKWGIEVPIIAGGPYATSEYHHILKEPEIDLVVIGEGEITFAELMAKFIENSKQLPDESVLKQIPGLAFLPGINARRNIDRQRITVDASSMELPGEKIGKRLAAFNEDLENE